MKPKSSTPVPTSYFGKGVAEGCQVPASIASRKPPFVPA